MQRTIDLSSRELVDVSAQLSERSYPRRLLGYDAGVIQIGRSCNLASDRHPWARPYRQTGTTPAAFPIAHDIAPLGTADVAVAVGERGHIPIDVKIMAGTDEVPDLMR